MPLTPRWRNVRDRTPVVPSLGGHPNRVSKRKRLLHWECITDSVTGAKGSPSLPVPGKGWFRECCPEKLSVIAVVVRGIEWGKCSSDVYTTRGPFNIKSGSLRIQPGPDGVLSRFLSDLGITHLSTRLIPFSCTKRESPP